jgi:hypothetical protein
VAASGSGSAEAGRAAGPKAVTELWSEIDCAQHLLGVRVRVGEGVSAGDALEYANSVSAGCGALTPHRQQQLPCPVNAMSASCLGVILRPALLFVTPKLLCMHCSEGHKLLCRTPAFCESGVQIRGSNLSCRAPPLLTPPDWVHAPSTYQQHWIRYSLLSLATSYGALWVYRCA